MQKNESSLGELTSISEDKNNVRYIKAGLTATAFLSGAVPYLMAGAVAARVGLPIVLGITSFVRTNTGDLSYNDKPHELRPTAVPRSFVKLYYKVIPTLKDEYNLLNSWGIPYKYGTIDYKIVWEHIRRFRTKWYDGTCRITVSDVLRKLRTVELTKFLEFRESKGERSIEWILDAQR